MTEEGFLAAANDPNLIQTTSGSNPEAANGTAVSDPTQTPNGEGTAQQIPEWHSVLDSVDPKDLVKHKRVAGIIGDSAQRRADRLVTDRLQAAITEARTTWEAEAKAQADRDHLLRDPIGYRDSILEQQENAAQTAQEREAAAVLHKPLADQATAMFEQLPEDLQDQLGGKRYPGSYAEGLAAFIAEMTTLNASYQRSQWEKEAAGAIKKDVLSQVNGSQASPKVTGAGAGVAGSHDPLAALEAELESYLTTTKR